MAAEFGMEVRFNASYGFLADTVDQDFATLKAHIASAVATEADMIVLCFRNDAHRVAFRQLRALRSTHTFQMVWAPQVPWGGASCAGFGANCSYAVGATQISLPQAESTTDDALGGMTFDTFCRKYNGTRNTENTDVNSAISAFVQSVQTVFYFRTIENPATFLDDEGAWLVAGWFGWCDGSTAHNAPRPPVPHREL